MIEALRRIVPQVVTPAAVNAQLATLNALYSSNVEPLPSSGVIDMWATTLLEMPTPSIGYLVGWNKDGVAQLQWNGLWRNTVPLWFYVVGPGGQTPEGGLQAVAIMFEALVNVIGLLPPSGLESQQLSVAGNPVTPVRAIAHVYPGRTRLFTIDAVDSGAVPGLEAEYDCEMYTATN